MEYCSISINLAKLELWYLLPAGVWGKYALIHWSCKLFQPFWKAIWKPGCGFLGLALSSSGPCTGPFSALVVSVHLLFLFIGTLVQYRLSPCVQKWVELSFKISAHLVQLFSRASHVPPSTQQCEMSEPGGTLQIINANPALQMRKPRPRKATHFLQNSWEWTCVPLLRFFFLFVF